MELLSKERRSNYWQVIKKAIALLYNERLGYCVHRWELVFKRGFRF
jgi:hypothetical protein